ncbi:MAG: glycosyltransferase [Bacteroides oleiciplenus]|nr:glycosyltransferase [Bacteroides oleiciplenus]
MSRMYFLFHCFLPNTANTNRILSFLREIDNMGYNITVCFFEPDSSFNKIPETFNNFKIVYYWDRFYFNNKFFKHLSYYYYLYRFVKDVDQGDTVFLNGLWELASIIVKRKKNVRVFMERSEHPLVVSPNLKFYRPSISKYLQLCRRLTGLFVISHPLKKYFIDSGLEKDRIHIINMTVDPHRFEGIKKKADSEKYIAYCGTVSNNKDGVDELIKSFGLVVQKHKNVKLYIIGETPLKDDETGNLQLIESLDIKDKVVFTGIVPAEEMPQLLKNAEVLALARPNNLQAQHGFPTKLGEYLLTENPVVVTKVGDIPLFLEDGVSALLAEPQNTKEFADKLCWALEHPKEAAIIGRNGKEVALREFNAKIETKKLMNVIMHSK